MVTYLPQLTAHFVEFGCLADPVSGEPARHLGRERIRLSAAFPQAAYAHALPGRVADHVGGLHLAIAGSAALREALLLLPSYEDRAGADGRAVGRRVTLQRIRLTPHSEPAMRPGDSTHSRALVLDWPAYAQAGPAILADAARLLTIAPTPSTMAVRARIGTPRLSIATLPRPEQRLSDLTPPALAILAGLAEGDLVRLDDSDCPDEGAFLAALADALEAVPGPLRGHVSAAAGLTRPDAGIQVAWAPGLARAVPAATGWRDLFPAHAAETSLALAGRGLFPAQPEAPAVAAPADEARFCGEIVTTREDPGIMPQIRHWLAGLAPQRPSADAPDLPATVLAGLACLKRGGLDGRDRRWIAAATLRIAAAQAATTVAESRTAEPGPATAAQILCGEIADPIAIAGLGLALTVATDAAAEMPALADRAAATARRELRVFLAAQPLIMEPVIAAILASEPLAEATAALVAEEGARLAERLSTGIALVELLGEEGGRLAERARQRLLPSDHRARQAWPERSADAADLTHALGLLVGDAGPALGGARDAAAIARRLIALGRRDLVVAATGESATRMDAAADETPAFHQRLAVINALSVVLLRSYGKASPYRETEGGTAAAVRTVSSRPSRSLRKCTTPSALTQAVA